MGLSAGQEARVREWFPTAEPVADLGWGLVDTVVLQLRTRNGDVVVKAAGPANRHIGREITAHRQWTRVWTCTGHAAPLLHADREQNVLATAYLPGRLAQDDPTAVADPDTYRQAVALLARFHGQSRRVDAGYEERMDAKAVAWLDSEHRIEPAAEAALRRVIADHARPATVLVPTHGDWHTRNWLVDAGVVRVIDLGRAQWRPAPTDLARLSVREWPGRPDLEQAFLDGYGSDPREPAAWQRTLLREAVGTAVWAYQVGDEAFEAQGHRMIAEALDSV